MQTGHKTLKRGIGFISAAIGGLFGQAGGPLGAVLGVISGLLVGYYYVHFTFKLRSRSILSVFQGTLYGALAGLISGVSAHMPNFLIQLVEPSHNSMLSVGAMFGMFVGIVFGFFAACLIAYMPREKENPETGLPGNKPVQAAQGTPLSPEEAELILAVYQALKEHNLFDRYTAKAYQAKFGSAGSQAELEGRYTVALAWLQIKRPDFSSEQWEQGNAGTHQLVRYAISGRAGGEAGLKERCPGLGEEFYSWVEKAARLFA